MGFNPKSEIRNPQLEHITVLLRETVDLIQPRPGGVYLDGTLGGGGHAEELLRRTGPDGIVIGLDQDEGALVRAAERLSPFGTRAVVRRENFRNAAEALADLGLEAIDGAILDLGLSWFHLRTPERGFSFQTDGPLDMRMDQRTRSTAADLVNTLPRQELTRILREYGEEKKAALIAKAIEKARTRGPITSTVQLAEIVSSVFPPYPPRRIHPATLSFQALRIAVNDEMNTLAAGLEDLIRLLRPGGRIAVISFHSLEDRIVKQSFVEHAKTCICPPKFPQCRCGKRADLLIVTKRPISASEAEIASNPASRSAKLRAAEKVG
ncbi:MAG: 16S rRNA (cytosine(1402)-N(4))-methyltransferase RsmH [Nitrospirota bacterium]|nr:16S rRNA (cytosine(1402)-N(4))-methyltransferase RsmH [Nitrospirota bacterium]